jgi:hypothetical protein
MSAYPSFDETRLIMSLNGLLPPSEHGDGKRGLLNAVRQFLAIESSPDSKRARLAEILSDETTSGIRLVGDEVADESSARITIPWSEMAQVAFLEVLATIIENVASVKDQLDRFRSEFTRPTPRLERDTSTVQDFINDERARIALIRNPNADSKQSNTMKRRWNLADIRQRVDRIDAIARTRRLSHYIPTVSNLAAVRDWWTIAQVWSAIREPVSADIIERLEVTSMHMREFNRAVSRVDELLNSSAPQQAQFAGPAT